MSKDWQHTSDRGVRELLTDDPTTVSYDQLVEASDGLQQPLLIRGACRQSIAANWTLDELFGLEPEDSVTAEYYPDGDRRKQYERVDITFADLRQKMNVEPEHWYLAERDLDTTFPKVAVDLPRLSLLTDDARHILRLVFFGTNTQSATHFHVRDQAVLEHLRGKKRVVLAGPNATGALATNSPFGGRPQFSTHGPEVGENAVECFTRLAGDDVSSVDLEAGDSLFIPVHWWHWVEGIGECLSVTTFWRASIRDWGYPHPAIRAATAVALGQTAKTIRGAAHRVGITKLG